jgi:hypothetical protein
MVETGYNIQFQEHRIITAAAAVERFSKQRHHRVRDVLAAVAPEVIPK